jgi:nitrate reductase gamma subunit
MSFIIGAILPPLTIILFTGGLIYQISQWKKLPSPPMTLTPAPKSNWGRLMEVLKESFLFKKLFHGDLTLWLFALLFHVTLAISLLDHYDRILAFMGITTGTIFTVPFLSGGVTGIVMLVCAAILFIRRFVLKRVAEISAFDDYFALLLIIAVVATGDVLRFMSHFDVVQTREYFSGLLSFSYKGLPQNNWFIAHYLIAQVLIIYIPFSKIMHLGGIFFTQAAIHKD